MKKILGLFVALLMWGTMLPTHATNGDNLIGVGPVSRGMGGIGVAAPQDSITAIFDNPAAMGFCPCGVNSEAIFGATLFDPTVKARITTPMGTLSGTSQHKPFIIPAMGITAPLSENVKFGVGAYGISGMGVDYRNMGWDLDGNPANGFEGDLYTRIEIMKFAPMLSYQANENVAVGIALQGAYNNVDLGMGGSHDYSYGAQLGVAYNSGPLSLGFSYTTPEKSSHERVFNFDAFMGDSKLDTLDLEAPAAYVGGVAYQFTKDFMMGLDLKYYDWENAAGYEEFDWQGQFVIALGTQVQATEKLTLRAGWNYGENPVKEHTGWNPMGVTTVQGKSVPTFGYEMLRTIGLPAIVEHHATVGMGYKITEDITVNVEYMHAFEETLTNASAGNAIVLESSLEEDSYSFSLGWEF